MPTPTTKIALVTGANKGIGFEVARGIAAAGYTVLIGARKHTLGEAAPTNFERKGIVSCRPQSKCRARARRLTPHLETLSQAAKTGGVPLVPRS